jgi:tetratricopeptide (TPR) repeat protein
MSLGKVGDVLRAQGDYAAARAYYEESLRVREAVGDVQGIARVNHGLGRVALAAGDPGAAIALFNQALATFRRLGDQAGAGECEEGIARAEEQPAGCACAQSR